MYWKICFFSVFLFLEGNYLAGHRKFDLPVYVCVCVYVQFLHNPAPKGCMYRSVTHLLFILPCMDK